MNHKKNRRAVAGFILGLSICGLANGQSAPGSMDDTSTDNWGRHRQSLKDAGWALEGGYKADFLQLVGGGLRHGGRPIGHLDLSLEADLEKIVGWSNTTAFLNYLHDHGEKFNADRVGSLLGVSNIEVPVDTYRLFHAWVQKEWNDGRFSLLTGLYPIDSEFQVLETASIFIQPPYGPTGDLSLTRGPSIFNTSAVGVRAKWLSDDRSVYVQGAVLDGIPGDPDRPKGTHIAFDKGDGTMSIVELGLKTVAAGDASKTPAENDSASEESLEDKYAVGYWNYSEKVDDLADIDASGNPIRRRSAGAYALAERSLFQGQDGFNLFGFVRIGVNDGNTNPIRRIINTGIMIRAPFASRPEDVLGLAFTHASMGNKFRTAQAAAGLSATTYESAWELTYRYAALPWLALQPVLQGYRNPGADATVENATVAGLRLEFSL